MYSLGVSVVIHIPRPLVCARNDVFKAIMVSNMIESINGVISLDSSCIWAQISFVVHLITGVFASRPEDIFELLSLANQFGELELVKMCEYVLCRQVDVGNVKTLVRYATEYSLGVLAECCMHFILQHYDCLFGENKELYCARMIDTTEKPETSVSNKESDVLSAESMQLIQSYRQSSSNLFSENAL